MLEQWGLICHPCRSDIPPRELVILPLSHALRDNHVAMVNQIIMKIIMHLARSFAAILDRKLSHSHVDDAWILICEQVFNLY